MHSGIINTLVCGMAFTFIDMKAPQNQVALLEFFAVSVIFWGIALAWMWWMITMDTRPALVLSG